MRLVCVLTALGLLVVMSDLRGGDQHTCACCGCSAECQKTCRLVCEEKKVEVVCFGEKKEDFCIPCPSKPGCRHDETVCDSCKTAEKDGDVTSKPKRFVWRDWIPGVARIHTRTKLMKRVETKIVPTYKWVVEDLCPACRAMASNEEKNPSSKQ